MWRARWGVRREPRDAERQREIRDRESAPAAADCSQLCGPQHLVSFRPTPARPPQRLPPRARGQEALGRPRLSPSHEERRGERSCGCGRS